MIQLYKKVQHLKQTGSGNCSTFFVTCLLFLLPLSLIANDIEVSNVSLVNHDDSAGINHPDNHTFIEFDIEWKNSWRSDQDGSGNAAPYNWDAAWVFAKFRLAGESTWQHVTIDDGEYSAPSNATIDVPPQKTGAFIYRSSNGSGTFQATDVRLRWNYIEDDVNDFDDVTVSVQAIEMVYIPEGSFQLGDGRTSNVQGHFHEANDQSQPFQVTSEGSITLGGTDLGNLGNFDGQGQLNDVDSDPDDWDQQNPVTLGADFPKGYHAFYMMKYQITKQQYVDFLNMVPSSWASSLWRGSDHPTWRYEVTESVGMFSTSLPHVQKTFISYADGAAYADWAGLRPMTEMEYEKAARGDQSPVVGEYAWGTTNITPAQSLQNAGTANEQPSDHSSNTVWDQNLTPDGPVRAGMFATSSSNRVSSGASYYGVMNLSCTNLERVVTTGRPEGRNFEGTHGDGELTNAIHTPGDWPAVDAVGIGYKGLHWHSWTGVSAEVSSREQINNTRPDRYGAVGFRAVRTAP